MRYTLVFVLFLSVLAPLGSVTLSGQLNYRKTLPVNSYSNSGSSMEPIAGALVEARNTGGTVLAQTYAGADGQYSLTFETTSSISLFALTTCPNTVVGKGYLNTGGVVRVTEIYEFEFASGILPTNGTHNLEVTDEDSAAACNIFVVLDKARNDLKTWGYSLPVETRVVYPSSDWSYYSPNPLYLLTFMNSYSDPDGFDDDILRHEFGHAVMDMISRDESQGGEHTAEGIYDLRLSFSEGAAQFLAAVFSDDPVLNDYTRDSYSSVDIANPTGGMVTTGNENAVAYVMYKAWQLAPGKVLDALFGMEDSELPTAIAGATADFDTFHYIYEGDELSVYALDRKMAYYADSNDSATALSPVQITVTSYSAFNQTFYPGGNTDHFMFQATAGDTWVLETQDTRNGALTRLKLYDPTETLVASNTQRNNLDTDTTSLINYKPLSSGWHRVEVIRFQSDAFNYGLAETDSSTAGRYSETAGMYGNYDLLISVDGIADGTDDDDSGVPSTPTDTTNDNTNDTSGGDSGSTQTDNLVSGGSGGGGGCLIKKGLF